MKIKKTGNRAFENIMSIVMIGVFVVMGLFGGYFLGAKQEKNDAKSCDKQLVETHKEIKDWAANARNQADWADTLKQVYDNDKKIIEQLDNFFYQVDHKDPNMEGVYSNEAERIFDLQIGLRTHTAPELEKSKEMRSRIIELKLPTDK